jgi:hypothetical protein
MGEVIFFDPRNKQLFYYHDISTKLNDKEGRAWKALKMSAETF